MTLLLWVIACVLWAVALYRLSDKPSRPVPPEYVSREWLAQFRRSRDE